MKEMYEEITEVLKVLAHPVRLSLVKIMVAKGPINVTTMYEMLQMPQSTISQHLSKLKATKVVTGTRKGLEIYYEVTDNRTKSILLSLA
ncbi:TPA: winged helix-turn-helix transcriptional regulator [Bacillus pacificus]|uniref:ArsR/SmtB family transcription factor n=1 Tax=Bacillus cereus group TaxID=86661 RepID=UPI00077227E9|nr:MULTISPECIES: metalloregulator ArsR/SmtB family transcription factor [Bacillus cereus group]KXI53533.1 ArsR family transcriptional regulator [Bacillus cereus]MCC2390710.1 metalloregulator ArsR/SmtB family transcription factor [Bacillus pacificus]MDA2768662.1 metalloregulator ArsR/SmtB family transcription factor [Bacillus cereus group sp. Bc010]MED1445108.1 metalloregulator ArsR/SmtB family transcription factor [Bacillus pacificus]HDR7256132.1 winged helix-turn-helix transcriptional regulat